jgi:prepilin-type processing-associated H-X9-DG protein
MNLFTGDDFNGAMVRVTLPRHGGVSWGKNSKFNPKNNLPGAINIAFVDGHADTVALEDLWKLYWHKNWDPKKVPLPHPASAIWVPEPRPA